MADRIGVTSLMCRTPGRDGPSGRSPREFRRGSRDGPSGRPHSRAGPCCIGDAAHEYTDRLAARKYADGLIDRKALAAARAAAVLAARLVSPSQPTAAETPGRSLTFELSLVEVVRAALGSR